MTLYDRHAACLRDRWSDDLTRRALPLLTEIALQPESAASVLDTGNMFPLLAALEGQAFPEGGAFFRLGGFSFKDVDAFHVLGNGRVSDLDDAKFLFSAGLPRRMRWALHNIQEHGDIAKLEILPWVKIRPEIEFRAFVFGRALYGITQYHPEVKGIVPDKAEFQVALLNWIATFISDLPDFDIAVDFACFDGGPKVIELNPYTPKTHLGLYGHKSLWKNTTPFMMN